MAFQLVLARVVKVLVTLSKYAHLGAVLQSKKPIESLVRSHLTERVMSALVEAGVPLDRLDLQMQAETWANEVLDSIADPLQKHGLVVAPDTVSKDLNAYITRLLGGKAIANGIPAHRHQSRSADPVVLHRGEFEREVTDLEVAGAGIDFAFIRTYRSAAAYLGPL